MNAPCHDCGEDTFHDHGRSEWYMVEDEVWLEAGMKHPRREGDGFLCIGCLEKRLGRTLRARDFIHAPCNKVGRWNTLRLNDRLTRH